MEPQDKTSVEVKDDHPSVPATEENKTSTENPSKADGQDAKGSEQAADKVAACKEKRSKKHGKSKHKKSKKQMIEESSDDSDNEEEKDGDASSDSDTEDTESEDDSSKKKNSSKKRSETRKTTKKTRSKKQEKSKKKKVVESSDSESESEEDESPADEAEGDEEEQDDEEAEEEPVQTQQNLAQQLQLLQLQQAAQLQGLRTYQFNNPVFPMGLHPFYDPNLLLNSINQSATQATKSRRKKSGESSDSQEEQQKKEKKGKSKGKAKSKGSTLDFKRVDHVWDNTIHNYKLQDTAEGSGDAQYEEFIFHVRRTFDWEGKYKCTWVDIKSPLLRECLQDVMGNIKGVSLVEETPKLDPNLLFLYLEDLRTHQKELKTTKSTKKDKHERKKDQKRIALKRQHLKVLIKYIDKDYADVKKSLYPMLENGLITFDLLWALFKPGTLAYTTTYGAQDEPRVFKVESAEKHYGIMRGDYYIIEGKYFEYDGKQFGYGNIAEDAENFQGAKKITSLKCYPLKFHKNEKQLRQDLIARGKKFVSLGGMHYKSHQGMAFYKKKKSVIKVNVNGRVMVDPSIHRRINPNYPISMVRPKDADIISEDEDSDDESGCGCDCDSDSDSCGEDGGEREKVKWVTKAFKDSKGKYRLIRVPKSDSDDEEDNALSQVKTKGKSGSEKDGDKDKKEAEEAAEDAVPEFSDEDYLIASPVVLGFAFAEKLWLELTVSGVKEIQWNESAYDSLVLTPERKEIVKALVKSHKYHAAESVDDVIQGKGKGLVAVLHGPPGTGKTLTAEGISELLKCPLYMVSAGELGTDSRFLENELQKILDICHTWGAILLLDEADVFMEKRNMHDIHRNALVSIFLRLLEYFQGILFLTTNRVETFDDAFQSRIHIALRYDNLDHKAKKSIFKIFIDRVRDLEKNNAPFTEEDLNVLARHELNGRQIKNTVRTAQALAVDKGEPLAMKHISQVLDVQMQFQNDLAGGPGYQEAMRGYM